MFYYVRVNGIQQNRLSELDLEELSELEPELDLAPCSQTEKRLIEK